MGGGRESPRVGAVVLYDADCGLCCRSAEFVARRDPARRFRLAHLGSDAGRALLARHGLAGRTDTLVLVDERGRAWTRSSAALRIARRLRGPARLLALLLVVPRPLRDWAYDLVARNRHRLAAHEACPAPSPELRARLLR